MKRSVGMALAGVETTNLSLPLNTVYHVDYVLHRFI